MELIFMAFLYLWLWRLMHLHGRRREVLNSLGRLGIVRSLHGPYRHRRDHR